MIEPDFMLLSQSTSDRYGRAVHEYRRAHEELLNAWVELVRNKYARDEATNPPGPSEDLG